MLSFRNFKYNLHPWLIHVSLFLKLIALSLQSASIGFLEVEFLTFSQKTLNHLPPLTTLHHHILLYETILHDSIETELKVSLEAFTKPNSQRVDSHVSMIQIQIPSISDSFQKLYIYTSRFSSKRLS
ncbi:hypothetical protein HanRHA438_Chr07g0309371 [Helianthus annuus]|uniref:Uncharacterized protein n=1 Tax=Helianthus annuus TaxID=4232 RepID=A0A251THI9_HELAN|nr:hypothetical protein HanXRQr2_Chr07g0299101 [Helianthus annuus]KAJ0550486.1 hypothetical protein HanHA300_Chr07g0246001 [Helianthus annuus]KAJ0557237.1 hypothetical protein HanIR_Chr07g0322891 [Helianthus annuus]KAJ0563444.1 hypothetical protein HanHA89_Chr07g0263221 [Helianthus annuus]KAJ0728781.1 hypothetical protein HanLR1_Chr07g0245581 [Helianthus annuus]